MLLVGLSVGILLVPKVEDKMGDCDGSVVGASADEEGRGAKIVPCVRSVSLGVGS